MLDDDKEEEYFGENETHDTLVEEDVEVKEEDATHVPPPAEAQIHPEDHVNKFRSPGECDLAPGRVSRANGEITSQEDFDLPGSLSESFLDDCGKDMKNLCVVKSQIMALN
eukprot:8272783-Ditylum_brightwellii.AAC.1